MSVDTTDTTTTRLTGRKVLHMMTAATTDTISMSNPVPPTTTSTSLSDQIIVTQLIVQVCSHCALLV